MSAQQPNLSPGWSRQMMQLPSSLGLFFRRAVDREGYGGVKVLGTAATALLLGAPERARAALLDYVLVATRTDPNKIDVDLAWRVFSRALSEEQTAITHYVDRILDPELSLPRGQKPSDKAQAAAQPPARKQGRKGA